MPELFPNFLATQISPTELLQLLEPTLSAPSPKYLEDTLGILSLDAGKYVPSCDGVAPKRVLEFIEREQAVSGELLFKNFGGPPYGYTSTVVQACAAGLLRAGKIRIEVDSGQILTAARDAGARDVFEKDRNFRRASFFPAQAGTIGAKEINRICKFFEERLNQKLDRDPGTIADAVSQSFPAQAERLRDVLSHLNRLPAQAGEAPRIPHALGPLEQAIAACVKVVRQTEPTLQAIKRNLDALNDGFQQLAIFDSELTEAALQSVTAADHVAAYRLRQLEEMGGQSDALELAAEQIRSQLAGEKPWRDLTSIEAQLETVRDAYLEARRGLLASQGQQEEAVRGQLKARAGFATLTADQSHRVLRPIAEALCDTTEDAISPGLVELRDQAGPALARAEEIANQRLDQILSEANQVQVRTIGHRLRNREIKSEAELDTVLDELRERVEPELRAGRHVRLVD